LPWSKDHLEAIRRIEQATLRGGLFAMAMPRGSGKTSLALAAALWALLYGHRKFVVLIAATALAAEDLLAKMRDELEKNPLLAADFPEVCLPLRALEGITNRQRGQTYLGRRTDVVWGRNTIVLPTIEGSAASGCRIVARGLSASIRGLSARLPSGEIVRPSLVILDDPQTDSSARSPTQTMRRLELLNGAVLGLAGPGQKISGIMACTVIHQGDLADQILNRERFPQWQGLRTSLVYEWPKNTDLWQQYAELRAESLRRGNHGKEATDFYQAHRAEMDAGAVVAWPERYNPDELSALQHAWNLRLDLGEAAFASEYQNQPLSAAEQSDTLLTVEQIITRLNRHRRGIVPVNCTRLTAFIDVHAKLLYWAVVGWDERFGGAVVAYGTWPEQNRSDFQMGNAARTLKTHSPGTGLEGAIRAGLDSLAEEILGREWPRDDGTTARIDRCLVDANWGEVTDLIYQWVRESPYAPILLPSHGRAIGPAARPISEWSKKPGDRIGLNWLLSLRGARRARHVIFDANYWKSFVRQRLTTTPGDAGALVLYGSQPGIHRLFAEHLTAEYSEPTEGRGRRVDVWQLKPNKPDNHWWDCLVGCAVAASIEGVALEESKPPTQGKPVSLRELQRKRWARRGRNRLDSSARTAGARIFG